MFNVLIVDPDERVSRRLRHSIQAHTYVESQQMFAAAKQRLTSTSFDFLVTNLRLEDFNGLHLVYLAAGASAPVRSIVYTAAPDRWLAREVQRAGAFYETLECLTVTLSAYLRRTLPPSDRRHSGLQDRRARPRGGRRCWDDHVLNAQA